MGSDHIEGLRKAARRVFWEAKNIGAQKDKERRDVLMKWIETCERLAERFSRRNEDHERWVSEYSKRHNKSHDYTRAFADGNSNAYAIIAQVMRYELENEDED